jgi:hypothetical protein
MNTITTNPGERERELEQRLADLQKRLPKHSVPASMMIELEELEEALAAVRRQTRLGTEQHPNEAEIASLRY